MTRRILSLAVAFSVCAISSSSSVGAQAAAQDQPSVFRTAARLVPVNVTVMDAHGKPVTDLDLGDFTIRESGKLREIALFRFEGGTANAAAHPPLPPGVFSNQVQFIGGPPRNITALLLDAANTSIVDNWFVRDRVADYLKKSLTPDTRLAIYLLGDRLTPVVDFTDDAALLQSRLDQVLIGLRPLIRFREDRIRLTLGALDAVARHLEGIPGRKNIVWITGGFSVISVSPIPGADARGMGPLVSLDAIESEVRRAAQSLAQRGVALYIEDASGLSSSRSDAAARPAAGAVALRQASIFRNGLIGTMTAMAATTGGRYLFNNNDMTAGLKAALDDVKASYTLGFYAADADERWHPLEVRVNRRGLTLRNRQGWIAESNPQPAASGIKEAWQLAIESPLGSSAILMSARCQRASNDAPGAIQLILRIDANTVAFEPREDLFVGTLDVSTMDHAADGAWREFTQRVTVEWDDKRLAAGRRTGIVYVRTWEPQADVTSVRVSVLDRNTGR